MYCSKCGTELPDNAEFCVKCGTNIKNPIIHKKIDFKPIPIVITLMGTIGTIYSLSTISEERNSFFGYTYEPPYTDHEIGMIILTIISIIALIFGLCAFSFGNNDNNTVIEKTDNDNKEE